MLLRVSLAFFFCEHILLDIVCLQAYKNYNIMYYLSLMPWHGGFFLLNFNKQSWNQTVPIITDVRLSNQNNVSFFISFFRSSSFFFHKQGHRI